MNLRILSLNAFGVPLLSKNVSTRLGHIADVLHEENPDIICLQEVFFYRHVRTLQALLPEYPYVAYKRFLYGPKGGLVIYSKLPIIKSTFTGFSQRGSLKNTSSLAAKLIRNGVLSVELEDEAVIVYNTHLTANTDVEWSEGNRFSKYLSSQLNQIKDMVHRDLESGRKLIVTGDFNTPPDSFLYKEFIEASGLEDIFVDKSKPTYHERFLPQGKIAKQIDYIFILSQDNTLVNVGTDYILEHPIEKDGEQYYLSDHIGMMADLQVTKYYSDYA